MKTQDKNLKNQEGRIKSVSKRQRPWLNKKITLNGKSSYGESAGKKVVLATDSSEGSFKFAYLAKTKDRLELLSCGQLKIEHLGLEFEEPLEVHKAGMAWLKKNSEIEFGGVIVVSSGLDFFIRKLELPALKSRELIRAVTWEIDKQIPIPAESAYLHIKKDISGKNISSLTVGAVPIVQVDRWEYLKDDLVGVLPASVSLVPLGPKAISRELAYCYLYQSGEKLVVGFFNSEGLQYARHAVIASPYGTEFSFLDNGVGMQGIVDELSGSIEVFYSHFPEMKVAGIIPFVPPDKLIELSTLISESILIDVIPVDPYSEVSDDHKSLWKLYGTDLIPLIGAVLVQERDFIFFPKALQLRLKLRNIKRKIKYSIAFLGMSFMVFSAQWFAEWAILQRKLDRLLQSQNEIENSEAFRKNRENLMKSEFISFMSGQHSVGETQYSNLYKSLGLVTPTGIYLENVSAGKNGAGIQGKITAYFQGESSKADFAILRFIENLQSDRADRIKLNRSGGHLTDKHKIENFSIDVRWNPNG